MIHLLFEQSGAFKRAFEKFGIAAKDYDICDEFNCTDIVIDLFAEIDKAYSGLDSVFDLFYPSDLVFAFFPCTYFSSQFMLHFKGVAMNCEDKLDLAGKLEKDIYYHNCLNRYYSLLCKLCLVAIKKNLRIIIENPYTKNHYLCHYFCLVPSLVDFDRRKLGDVLEKPTQFYTINFSLKCNLQFIAATSCDLLVKKLNGFDRCIISDDYAYNFLKTYILSYDLEKDSYVI